MSNEFGGKLEKVIMNEYWEMLEDRANPVVKGVWEKRDTLPITWQDSFETPSGAAPLELPLVGGGYVRLGRTDTENPYLDFFSNHRDLLTKIMTIN